MNLLSTFDPAEELIYLRVTIFGQKGEVNARMVLDTGATRTMVSSAILDSAGYDLEILEKKTTIITGSGVETVGEIVVQKIQALEHTLENLAVICHDLPEESGLDGLLGLNFLRHFDLEIKYSNATVSLTPLLA